MGWGALRWNVGAALLAVCTGLLVAVIADAPVFLVLGVMALVGGAWVARLDWWQRVYALTLTLMIGASSSIPSLAAVSFYARYVVAALLVVMTFRGRGVRVSDLPPGSRRFYRAFYLLAFTAAASTLWSFRPAVTAQQAVALAMLALLVRGLITHRWADHSRIGSDLRVAYAVLVAASAASIGAGLLGVTGSTAFNGRLQGVFANPNTLAMAAAMAVPLAWTAFRTTRQILWLAAAIAPIYAILASGSRTALLAVTLGALWLVGKYALRGKNVVLISFLILASVAAVTVFGQALLASQAISRLAQGDGPDLLNSRAYAWAAGVGLWRDRPLQGWGFQAGEALFEASQGSVGFYFTRTAAHSSYVQMLLELGAIGAVLMAYLVLRVVGAALKIRADGVGSGVAAVAIVGLAVFFTESAAFGTGQVFPWVYWPTVVALTISASRAAVGNVDGSPSGRYASRRNSFSGGWRTAALDPPPSSVTVATRPSVGGAVGQRSA